ncbi:PEGA domain-containing protein [Sandaracinus amylolyticus]|uniref:PEGA domain-containing protein n=1 Tax=Sandaracinus amylolyticus TaxID=927083 RepID=UPI001F3CB394|nr:PEGA domain-containing protein [Sandaracinus amylolyticus]
MALALGLALPPGLVPAIARAQDAPLDPAQAEALALFRRGVELGEQDRWADALEHFRRSRTIAERPNTVFNVAFALYRLGRFTQAIVEFEQYLAMTEGQPPNERRDEAVRLRGESVASLAEITLEIAPPDARVLVDGEPIGEETGSPRTLRLDPGRHAVRANADGYEEGALTISVLAGEHGARSMTLVARGGQQEEIVEPPPPPPSGGGIFEDPVFWVIAGVVVVGAGVAIGAGVAATQSEPPYGGSADVVLRALTF